MKIISSQDDADYQRKLAAAHKLDAKHACGAALRELLANLLRIARTQSGGQPHLVSRQMLRFLEAVQAHDELAGGNLAAFDIPEMLWFDMHLRCPYLSDEQRQQARSRTDPFQDAMETILAGACQVIASRLIWNKAQISRGEGELVRGVEQMQKIRERNWQEFHDGIGDSDSER